MEGNACYKFSTIRNYVDSTGAKPIQLAFDIGANQGTVTCEMLSYFPDCRIYAFEPIEEYYRSAVAATHADGQVAVFNTAVTAEHRYQDDGGKCPRARVDPLKILKALPASGYGYIGGSRIVPSDHHYNSAHYDCLPKRVAAVTLDEIVEMALKLEGADQIDLAKFDCEGGEISSLGCAGLDTLRRLRFIVGEYHGLERFYRVLEAKLFQTHYVSLIGDTHLGAFFAENIAERAGILKADRTGMRFVRPWLCASPIEWNIFERRFVAPGEEADHALPASA